jgi:hypothetical protein
MDGIDSGDVDGAGPDGDDVSAGGYTIPKKTNMLFNSML